MFINDSGRKSPYRFLGAIREFDEPIYALIPTEDFRKFKSLQ